MKNYSLVFYIFLGIIIGIFLKLFVFDFTKVEGSSMEPTLKNEQIVCIRKLSYGLVIPFKNRLFLQWKQINQNDVIIFFSNNNLLVKRCVATSEQNFSVKKTPLEFSDKSEYSLIVGEKNIPLTEEQFAFFSQYSCVPKGMFLAIGDNYASSIDSRNFGFVNEKNVAGKVLCK